MRTLNVSLMGKRALVCGASEGIGRATAFSLADQGASVVAVARSEARLGQVLEELPGKDHTFIAVDLNHHNEVRERIEKNLSDSGPFEILINNSAGPKGGLIQEANLDEFAQAFHQHLLTSQLLSQLLLPGMKAQGYGRIINVISTSVRVPIPGLGVSNTVRAAVAAWAKTLSQEVAAYGITVNSILPGFTKTGRLASLLAQAATSAGKTGDEVADEWKAMIPARRFADPEEVAGVIAFFASPAAGYVTGTTLAVDGGRTPAL
jgi:3-oxoacyl-[acyl-carrier protein] reductase